MMGERRVMQEALFYGFSLEVSLTIVCCARSIGSSTFRKFGGIWSRTTATWGGPRSIPS
jgi:hypothetical protein